MTRLQKVLLTYGGEDQRTGLSQSIDNGVVDIIESTLASDVAAGVVGETVGRPSVRLRPSTTWPITTQSEAIALEPPTTPAVYTVERGSSQGEHMPLTSLQREAAVSAGYDKLMKKHLEEVAKFEHRPSYRVFIWIPMVLQLVKLLVVCGSGSLLTKLCGWVYFIFWAAIEIVITTISQKPMTETELTRAVALCQEWTKILRCMDALASTALYARMRALSPRRSAVAEKQ